MSDSCSQCNKFFNLTKKRPIVLECTCTWCLECISFHLKDNPKREIYCPDDKEISTMPAVLKENKQLLRKLQSLDQLTVLCDDHNVQFANLYCISCQIPVCNYCQLGTHRDHQIIELKQSNFKIYTGNVLRLLDEYSIENIKSQLLLSSTNESQMKSSQFKDMICKVNRMLVNVVSHEEYQKIDFTQSLEDPLNNPQNRQKPQKSSMVEEEKTQRDSNLQIIQQIINESQSYLREEFKQAFKVYETNQIKINNQINDSIKLTKANQDKYDKTLQEFKRDMQKNLQTFESFDNAFRVNHIKLNNVEQSFQKIQELIIDTPDELEQFKKQHEETKDNLEKYITYTVVQLESHKILLADAKTQRDKQTAKLDTLQLKVQELNENKAPNSKGSWNQDIEYKSLELLLPNVSIINEKLINVIKLFNGQKEDDPELLAYQTYQKDLMKCQFRLLVDAEIQKQMSSLLCLKMPSHSSKKYELLYRGTRDGFTALRFHELCDNRGPTIFFILSEYGQVFGGFTSVSWTSPNQMQSTSDQFAYLFSLSKRTIHKQVRNQSGAVQHHKNWMCYLGYCGDINISDNCDNNSNSLCDFGGTYELPFGYEYQSNEAKSYLAGKYQYKVLEIEVYSLK
eukprot:403359176